MATDKGQFQPGYVIDRRYRILGFLGAGGFASVYRAMHEGMQREVAVKVMEKCDDETFIERFKREAMLAGSIQNPCIVTIYDCGVIEETGQLYMAMELLHGHDLEEELKEKGPLSPRRMYTLIRPVLDALGEGHAQGIVHKDLKPANLFLNDPGGSHEYVKVLDFGVARKANDKKLTSTGQMMGTVLYLAPEYINNSENVSPAIDVYQMALIISELLTGQPCVDGETYSILMKHCMGEIQLADFLKEGPAAEVFARATCVRPEKRYQDCNEFGEALESIADYFDSDVPLCGGEAQTVSKTSEKLSGLSAKKTSAKVAPSPDTAKVEAPADEAKPEAAKSEKKRVSPVLLFVMGILVAIVALFTFLFILGYNEEMKKHELEAAKLAETPKPVAQAENTPKPETPTEKTPETADTGAPTANPAAATPEPAAPAAPAPDPLHVELSEAEKRIMDEALPVDPQFVLLRQAAEAGDDASWARLGIMYHDDWRYSEEEMFDAFNHIQDLEKLDASDQAIIYDYMGRYLYERLNSPKTPAIQGAKYSAVDCFRKAIKLNNVDSMTYMYENHLLEALGLDRDVNQFLSSVDSSAVSVKTAYSLGILYHQKCLQEQKNEDCLAANKYFKLAADKDYPGAKARMLESTICEFGEFNLKSIAKLAVSKSEECGDENCREANRIIVEWALASYNKTLSFLCWNAPKSLSKIEKYFSKTMSKDDYLNDLINIQHYAGPVHWNENWGRELHRLVSEARERHENMDGVFEVVSDIVNSVTIGNRRQACDAFRSVVDLVVVRGEEEFNEEGTYSDIVRCYSGAIQRGQLYAPFKGIEEESSTNHLLLAMLDITEVSRSNDNLQTYLPDFLYAATLGDGVAQSFLGGLYRDVVPEGLTKDFAADAARACYWDKLAVQSDFCQICTKGSDDELCAQCAASERNAQSCP